MNNKGDILKSWVEQFTEAFLEGNILKAKELLDVYLNDNEATTMDVHQLLTAVMTYIGDLWEQNIITVAQEHIATNVCKYVLHYYHLEVSMPESLIDSPNKKGMFYCIEDEQHDIGIDMISNIFKEAGWTTKLLGENMPIDAACQLALDWKPDLIGISISIPYHLPKLIKHIQVLNELPHQPLVIVGGRLVYIYDLSLYCPASTIIVKDLSELDMLTGIEFIGEVHI